MSILVKVCGMTSTDDVALCRDLGADFLGFIFHPASPRNVTPGFAASAPAYPAKKVGVLVKQSLAETLALIDAARLDFVQLAGGQDEAFCAAVGRERVVKVFWPERYAAPADLQADLERFAGLAAYHLLDAGSGGGGHGRGFDLGLIWSLAFPRPWLLAGGLSPETLPAALAACRPHGVDLNSGVESAPGVKDADKLRRAFALLAKAPRTKDQR
jgi:phosphoribosylanthranilate isomerase